MELINCAIIENDTVVNVIVVESLERAIEIFGGEIIDASDGKLAMGFVRVDGIWIDPNAPVVEIVEDAPVVEIVEEPTND
jgi:hypothetical protein